MIINGAYGPYIKGLGRRNNLKIPKDVDAKKLTQKKAEEMLMARYGTKAVSGATALKKRTSKTTTKKTTTKKASTSKHTTTRKTTSKNSSEKSSKKPAKK